MRLSYILLLAAATLLANANALATGGDAENRFLRSHKSHKKAVSATAAEEERVFLGLFRTAPEELPQFERMAAQSTFRDHIFESWRTGMVTVEGAASYMHAQGLTPADIKHWTELFVKYLQAKAHKSN